MKALGSKEAELEVFVILRNKHLCWVQIVERLFDMYSVI